MAEVNTEKVVEETIEKNNDVIEIKKLKKAFDKEKKVRVIIPADRLNPKDEYVTASINGYTLQIKRGVAVEIPEPFYKILKEAGYAY